MTAGDPAPTCPPSIPRQPPPQMGYFGRHPPPRAARGEVMTCGVDEVRCWRPAGGFASTGEDGGGRRRWWPPCFFCCINFLLEPLLFFAGTFFRLCYKLRELWCRHRHDVLLHQFFAGTILIFAGTSILLCCIGKDGAGGGEGWWPP